MKGKGTFNVSIICRTAIDPFVVGIHLSDTTHLRFHRVVSNSEKNPPKLLKCRQRQWPGCSAGENDLLVVDLTTSEMG